MLSGWVRRQVMKYAKLTEQQNKTMEKHKKHHSKKHMVAMAKMMAKGKSFTAAHKKAMKDVGK